MSHDLLGDGADAVLAALADRTRRRILVRLAEQPDDAGAVARDLAVSRQSVAKHLQVLGEAGIVQDSREGRRRVHRVEPSRILEVSELLGTVAAGWDRRLARIKEVAEEREREDVREREREAAQERQREGVGRPHRR